MKADHNFSCVIYMSHSETRLAWVNWNGNSTDTHLVDCLATRTAAVTVREVHYVCECTTTGWLSLEHHRAITRGTISMLTSTMEILQLLFDGDGGGNKWRVDDRGRRGPWWLQHGPKKCPLFILHFTSIHLFLGWINNPCSLSAFETWLLFGVSFQHSLQLPITCFLSRLEMALSMRLAAFWQYSCIINSRVKHY